MKHKTLTNSYLEDDNDMTQSQDLSNLYTTLPMTELITLFEQEISEVVAYDSFEYEHPQKSLHVFRGSPKLHKCHYKINARDIELGEITLTSKRPFSDGQMLTVEKALGALSIHMYNAIEHQATLGESQLTALQVESKLNYLD